MKILVIQQKMIGDVLTSSILLEALRTRYPDAQLHYLIYRHTLPVVQNNPFIDEYVLFEKKDKSGKEFYQFLKHIRSRRYDIVIDAYAKLGTALFTAFSGAGLRISYSKWYTRHCYTHVVERKERSDTPAGLAIENRLRLLQPISPNFPAELKPKIFLTAEELRTAEAILRTNAIPPEMELIMISVLGSSAEKTYPPEYLAPLLDKIARETSAGMLFNYMPSQRAEATKIFNLCRPETQEKIYLNVCGNGLRGFLGICSYCEALVGNEGGAVNMAKALNLPTFAIFSPAIRKEDWSLYENETTHVSVHLKDYEPELFIGKNKKDLRRESAALYRKFKPELIEEKLGTFLKVIRNSKE